MAAGTGAIRPVEAADCETLARIWEAGWQQVGPALIRKKLFFFNFLAMNFTAQML